MPNFRRLILHNLAFVLVLVTMGWPFFAVHGQTTQVFSIAWSPDGTRIATTHSDGSIRIWNAVTNDVLLTLNSDDAPAYMVRWSPDSSRIATSDEGGAVIIWDLATLEQTIFTIGEPPLPIIAIAWHPDGNHLIAGSSNGQVTVFDTTTGQVSHYPPYAEPYRSEVTTFAWSPDGARVAWNNSEFVILWTISTDEIRIIEHSALVTSIAWHPVDSRLAVGGSTGIVTIYDSLSGEPLRDLPVHTGVSSVSDVAWSPDGTRLAASRIDGAIAIWQADTGALMTSWEYPGFLRSIGWSPDGDYLAYGNSQGAVDSLQVSCVSSPPPGPATLFVSSSDTSGLLQAINAANSDGDPDVIALAEGEYVFETINNTADGPNGLPVITTPITIHGGNGATITREAAAPEFRLFRVAAGGNLTLSDVTLTNGNSGEGFSGGIIANSGALTLHHVTLSGGYADANGGAIFNDGTLTIDGGSVLTGNTARGFGGAVYSTGGTVSLTDGDLSGNTALGDRAHGGN